MTVTDDNGTPGNTADDFHPTFTGGDTNSNGLLDLTETWTYQASATATAGQYENFATVTGARAAVRPSPTTTRTTTSGRRRR